MSLLIFTQLDEILLSSEESSSRSIAEAIASLQSKNIPLVPITSKTRAETVDWMQKVGLNSPFIVEGGSGVFISQSDSRFVTLTCDRLDNYYLHQLGCSYTEARAALKAVQEEISKILRGFGDMDEEAIQSLIVTSTVARQAKAREFSEYFITPSRLEIARLQQVAAEYGFKIIPGKNLSLILGAKAEPAKAITWLKKNYSATEEIRTVGLGSTQADRTWLETVDIPIIIPNTLEVPAEFKDRGWQIINQTGLEGWVQAIAELNF